MANELEKTIKNIATKIAQYVDDAATINVETSYIQVGSDGKADFTQAKPGLRTTIRLDGDSEAILPVSLDKGGNLSVNTEMHEIHQRNVETAIEYRARILAALSELLRSYTG